MMRHALVVDDDQFMVKTLSDVLRLHGWAVTTAHNGRAAVDAAARERFDIVLMDIKMPELDGVAAFKKMKELRPDVRVILMTAYAANELIAEAEREGVLDVLAKPVDIRGLLTTLLANVEHREPVLLIDNDATFLRTLDELLRLRGVDTIVARDVDEAVELLRTRRPLAVLLHMHVGATSARDAVLAVHEVNPTVALILYSGRSDAAQELERALPRDRIHAFLQKPFAVEQLEGVLDAVDAN